MQTKRIYPEPALQSIVSHIMVFEKQTAAGVITPLPCFADGCPGVVFQYAPQGMCLNSKSHSLSSLFLYGQTIKPVTLLPKGSFRIIVFYLFPSSVSTVFGLPAAEMRDTCTDLLLLPNAHLFSLAQLLEAASVEEEVTLISRYLSTQARLRGQHPDGAIQHALYHLLSRNGKALLKDLHKHLHVTERTFERRFERHVGVTPKLFSRICQFQSALQQLQGGRFAKLSDLAYENGYADQSHFIRSFKEFTGINPLQYRRQVQPSLNTVASV